MALEKRGNSFRAKVYDGKRLVIQKTFATRAEAVAFHKIERAKLTVAVLPQKTLSDFIRLQATNSARKSQESLRQFDLKQQGYVHVSEMPAREPPAPRDRVWDGTLGDLARRYRDKVTPQKKGHEQETCKLNAILIPHKIAKKQLVNLSRRDFQTFRDERLTEVAEATVKKELNLWHAMIEFAREEWGLDLKENPARVRHPKVANSRDRRLVDDEEARLLAAAGPLMRDAIIVAIDTAMRQGEILKIKPTMLRHGGTTRAYLALPGTITKSGKPRDVPITERVGKILAARTTDNDLCFPVVSANALRTNFRRTRKRANVAGLTFHDLRHEATSRLFEARVYAQSEVMKITGHENESMVRRYLQSSGAELALRRRS